jgi:hypothetical protein
MNAFIRQLAGSILLVVLVAGQSPKAHRFSLLEPGIFHGTDVRLAQPVAWVGIYCNENACNARPTTVRSTRAPDPLGEDAPDAPTATSIDVSSRNQPLFLVRGIAASPRPVPTFFVGQQSMSAGDHFDIARLKSEYALHVEGTQTKDDTLPAGSRLVLSHGLVKQDLFLVPKTANDPYITVLWVGDLDGDGKPDFYVDSTWHYNISHKVLWLSSLAKPGQIVGKAAVFTTIGC